MPNRATFISKPFNKLTVHEHIVQILHADEKQSRYYKLFAMVGCLSFNALRRDVASFNSSLPNILYSICNSKVFRAHIEWHSKLDALSEQPQTYGEK